MELRTNEKQIQTHGVARGGSSLSPQGTNSNNWNHHFHGAPPPPLPPAAPAAAAAAPRGTNRPSYTAASFFAAWTFRTDLLFAPSLQHQGQKYRGNKGIRENRSE
ncbi:hypothetical protein Q8A73_022573 [Channa argus]|nr:hypothetical protein Q8A73_022573 [Channa argus]